MSRIVSVLKFGSSVLPDEAALPAAVAEIERWVRRGHRVIAVVSALGGTTDRLIARAKAYGAKPEESAYAALLATGEAEAVALLGLALDRAGVSAKVLDAAGIGLRTEGATTDASAVDLDVARVRKALERHAVLVVPGFIGKAADGTTTLLGRGGSDLTALFLAAKIEAAQCRLLKDVDGLYDRDPAIDPVGARRYERASYDDVLRTTEGIVQHKAVRYARDRGVSFVVAQCGREGGTLVDAGPTRVVGEVQARAA